MTNIKNEDLYQWSDGNSVVFTAWYEKMKTTYTYIHIINLVLNIPVSPRLINHKIIGIDP